MTGFKVVIAGAGGAKKRLDIRLSLQFQGGRATQNVANIDAIDDLNKIGK